MPLLKSTPKTDAPVLTSVFPKAAMPGGDVTLNGANLGPAINHGEVALPRVTIGDTPASAVMSRARKLTIRVPEGAISGDVKVQSNGLHSNSMPLRVAIPLAENLHPVANPAVDKDGNLYATFSGPRGEPVPVSIFRIDRDYQLRPFVRGLMNATGLAFDREGFLYASSRAEGTVYRISPSGAMSTYAEGLGVATGLAFDPDGNLYVGDRSGTIFKIARDKSAGPGSGPASVSGSGSGSGSGAGPDRQIFVYATLEPSMAAYHLAFRDDGTLFVSGPTTSSYDNIYAIDRNGDTTVYYRGLGRPQGLAFDAHGDLYVAASLRGQRGIIRITPDANGKTGQEASLAVSGNDLVGLAFMEDGCAALATRNAIYHVALDIDGRPLI